MGSLWGLDHSYCTHSAVPNSASCLSIVRGLLYKSGFEGMTKSEASFEVGLNSS